MDNFNLKKYLKEGKLSKKENLNEFTNYGGEGLYPMSEKPGDMFQQKEVEELFPIAFSSKDDKDFKDKLAQHADWTEQSGMNNTFVHVQYHETKNLPDDYFIYQSQHYNTNYDDFRNPRFTVLSITKNKDTDKEEDLGEYIVSTPEYIKDIRALDARDKLGRAVSENKIKTPQTKAIASAVQKHFSPQKSENLDVQATSIDFVYENRAQDLASDYSLGELNDMLKQLYGEMEQEAEPEGGPIANRYADEIYQYEEAIRIKKGVGQRGKKDIPYDVAIGRMTQDEYDKMMSQDLETRADDYFSEPLKEFIGGSLEKRSNEYFDKLVPGMGNADTIEGEMLRAINRIAYRFYNDGDYFYKGYGTETAGPAHSFLINSKEIPFKLQAVLKSIFNKIMSSPAKDEEKTYEDAIKLMFKEVLDYIDSKEGNYTKSEENMFNYQSEYEDEEDYEDDYYDDEDDEYYEK